MTASKQLKVFIGTSGWQYKHWKGDFYPEDIPIKNWLQFYIQNFNSVELNSSFYRMPKKEHFIKWAKIASAISPKFIFSLKLYLYFTRYKKLNLEKKDLKLLEAFLKYSSFLGKHLGPVLVQLPPNFKFMPGRLEDFLKEAQKIGNPSSKSAKFRYAFEFRNDSWLNTQTNLILKKYSAALVISDAPGWKSQIARTADFVFVRFHGKPQMAVSNYDNKSLRNWHDKLLALKPLELFAYFNNDALGHAPRNAKYFSDLFSA